MHIHLLEDQLKSELEMKNLGATKKILGMIPFELETKESSLSLKKTA